MDMVEKLVSTDDSQSRESGVCRSIPIRRVSPIPMRPCAVSHRLKPAAEDFRIYWDNAYGIHHLYDDNQDNLIEILAECKQAGNPDMVYKFCFHLQDQLPRFRYCSHWRLPEAT